MKNLKRLREDKGLSVEEAARLCGISAELLREIEEGRFTPSISTLINLSKAYGVKLSELMGEKQRGKINVVRKMQRKDVERRPKTGPSRSGYHYKSLASREGINAFLVVFEEKEEDERVFFQHQGKEFLFLLEGKLEICVEDERVILEPGDTASYESRYPHSLRGIGGPATAIVVVCGE